MIGNLLRADLRLHWRRGVVAAAGGAVVAYITLLVLVPQKVAVAVFPVLVFSDPAALGFFFVGGTLLADRSEGSPAAVLVTPARPHHLLAARTLSLGLIGVIGSVIIALGARLPLHWGMFLPAVFGTAAVYTLFGYAVAVRSDTVNRYFARATLLAVPLFAPIVAVFAFPTSAWLAAWPTTASLHLLQLSADPAAGSTPTAVAAFACLLVAAVAAALWARHELIAAIREGRL